MWYMQPVRVSIDVPTPRQEVFDFLDVMANHEPFTNHMLSEWEYSGPARGVGSKARALAKAAGKPDVIDITVVSADPPVKIVEENTAPTDAGGRTAPTRSREPPRRVRIVFEYSWQRAPISERLAAPLIRTYLRRANQRAMQRLAEQLAARAHV